ncbi:hypothetical protein [Aquincola tertiaricarbonis]|uniref:hypothetical protein n=1 Tax=Aquincola tertiaricarbonis TaxID=391953 RepID=UPI000614CD93|nr:hypothetical protein [Aquincola tertiaricarbonis]
MPKDTGAAFFAQLAAEVTKPRNGLYKMPDPNTQVGIRVSRRMAVESLEGLLDAYFKSPRGRERLKGYVEGLAGTPTTVVGVRRSGSFPDRQEIWPTKPASSFLLPQVMKPRKTRSAVRPILANGTEGLTFHLADRCVKAAYRQYEGRDDRTGSALLEVSPLMEANAWAKLLLKWWHQLEACDHAPVIAEMARRGPSWARVLTSESMREERQALKAPVRLYRAHYEGDDHLAAQHYPTAEAALAAFQSTADEDGDTVVIVEVMAELHAVALRATFWGSPEYFVNVADGCREVSRTVLG